ncbi:hypothetical protein [Neobacillus sp. LXY-4]|uniref:hypothetical protein n=1 Tax=Neobacillus sp. LXY-4 TaxID=3379826 RepID=UPI003EE1D00F
MTENTPEELVQIEQKAIEDERNAKSASNVVSHAISSMNAQRSQNRDKAKDRR